MFTGKIAKVTTALQNMIVKIQKKKKKNGERKQ